MVVANVDWFQHSTLREPFAQRTCLGGLQGRFGHGRGNVVDKVVDYLGFTSVVVTVNINVMSLMRRGCFGRR
jgi:hypothetical protein